MFKSIIKNIFLPSLLVFFIACEKGADTNLNELREQAWSRIDQNYKPSIKTKTEEAIVRKVSYKGREVFSVTFNTINDATFGPIIVYFSIDNREFIEIGSRL